MGLLSRKGAVEKGGLTWLAGLAGGPIGAAVAGELLHNKGNSQGGGAMPSAAVQQVAPSGAGWLQGLPNLSQANQSNQVVPMLSGQVGSGSAQQTAQQMAPKPLLGPGPTQAPVLQGLGGFGQQVLAQLQARQGQLQQGPQRPQAPQAPQQMVLPPWMQGLR